MDEYDTTDPGVGGARTDRRIRILYVTQVWSAFADALFEGREPRGMPAFIHPLRELVLRGHQVDLIVATERVERIEAPLPWLADSRVEVVFWDPSGFIPRWLSAMRLARAAHRALKAGRYDFVYCHGTAGAVGNLVSILHRVPCGLRIYGTRNRASQLRNLSQKRGVEPALARTRMWLAHPLQYLAFRLPKAFLLATDDGSDSAVIHAAITGRYRWLHWRNGVTFPNWGPLPGDTLGNERLAHLTRLPFLICPARIAPHKGQEKAIRLVADLRVRHGETPRLLLIGHVSRPDYAAGLEAVVRKLELTDFVEIVPPVEQRELWRMYRHPNCLAVLSFNDVSNLSNVSIEALATGSVLVSLDDGSLSNVVKHGESAVLANEISQAADWVVRLLQDPALRASIGRSAAESARSGFLDWSDRVDQELSLIADAVEGRCLRERVP